MIVSSIQDLLTSERATRDGATAHDREVAIGYVIDVAFNHAVQAVRKHAAGHLLSHGIAVVMA
jgi:hypothetical protein